MEVWQEQAADPQMLTLGNTWKDVCPSEFWAY